MNNAKKLIALPSLGAQATAYYEASLQALYQHTYGTQAQCPLLILNADFDKINEHLPDQFEALLPPLASLFSDLAQADVDSILIPNITLHSAIDQLDLPPEIQTKIIHPVYTGIKTLKSKGISEITLVGTRHTMQSEQISSYFQRAGINVLRPLAKDIFELDQIRIKVYQVGFTELLMKKMQDIFKAYSNVVLACTELSMLNRENDYYDLARMQIEQAISRFR